MKKLSLLTLLSTMWFTATAAQLCYDDITPTTPDHRFTVNGDTVIDNATGLTWMRCTLGQTGDDCSGGSATTFDWGWADILTIVDRDYSDWRLPTVKELSSIVELSCTSPAYNSNIFPNVVVAAHDVHYYTSTPNPAGSGILTVQSSSGSISATNKKSNGAYVRLVHK